MIKTFQAKIEGTRKMREWVAYKQTDERCIVIQSDDAIGRVYPDDVGFAHINRNGAYFIHLAVAKHVKFPPGTYKAAQEAAPKSGDVLSSGPMTIIQA